MQITIPELSLVVLIGASGSGKSTFGRLHFKPTEILSSDFCRGLVADDENDQSATKEAFEVLHFIARQPLWNNLKGEHGPFDIIGDIHGCFDELLQLLNLLGYEKTPSGAYRHAAGRKA